MSPSMPDSLERLISRERLFVALRFAALLLMPLRAGLTLFGVVIFAGTR